MTSPLGRLHTQQQRQSGHATRFALATQVDCRDPVRLLALSIIGQALEDVHEHRVYVLTHNPVSAEALGDWIELAGVDPHWVQESIG